MRWDGPFPFFYFVLYSTLFILLVSAHMKYFKDKRYKGALLIFLLLAVVGAFFGVRGTSVWAQSGAESGDAAITSAFESAASALTAKEVVESKTIHVPIAAPGILGMLQAATAGQMALQSYQENVSRPYKALLRDVIVKRITDMMTDMIIQWAQNGFQGKPLFISDWKQFVNQSADVAFDTLNSQLMEKWQVNLCAPFAPQLQLKLIGLQKYYSNAYAQESIPRCTIQGFENNLQTTEDYLRSGGWLAFDEVASPDNNYYGVSLQLADRYINQMNQEAASRQNEGLSAGGFLSQKTCAKHADPNDPSSSCTQWNTQTPGDTVAKSIGQAFAVGKYDFTSNVQSIVAAVVNGAISVLMNNLMQGLAGASSNYSQTTNYSQLLTTPLPSMESGAGGVTATSSVTSTDVIIQNYVSFDLYYQPVLATDQQALSVFERVASSCPDLIAEGAVTSLQSTTTALAQALDAEAINAALATSSTASSSDVVAAWQLFSSTYVDLWKLVLQDLPLGINSALDAAQAVLGNATFLSQQCSSR